METILAEAKINTSLHSKLLPPTNYIILPGDLLRVFKERSRRSETPLKVTRISKKIILHTDGIKVKPFNILAVLLIAPNSNDSDFKSDMEYIQAFLIQNDPIQCPIKILKPSERRPISQKFKDAIKIEISGLLERREFEYINKKFPINENVFFGCFYVSINHLGTEEER